MRVEYDIGISVDVGEVLPSVGDMIKSVNESMRGFGFHEKLCVRGKAFSCTFSANHEITATEKEVVKAIIVDHFNKLFQNWKVQIEWFALK